ncbi:MAG: FHA domain-containing protein [Bryobacterales bacterium]|nr:FHA domain-containing protein [Bryobacterales bacterium]
MTHGQPPPLRARVGSSQADVQSRVFQTPFRIGRAADCEFPVPSDYVSRYHAQVYFAEGAWWLKDLGSRNGLYQNGERVEALPVAPGQPVMVRLGIEGPFLSLNVEAPAAAAVPPVVATPAPVVAAAAPTDENAAIAKALEHFLGPRDGPVGEHTMMVRQAVQQIEKQIEKKVETRKTRRYRWVVYALVVALAAVGGLAYYLRQETGKQEAVAQQLFYTMKALDVDLASVEKLVLAANTPEASERIRQLQQRRREAEKQYDAFLASHRIGDTKLSEQDRLILRVTRIFGECELTAPKGYLSEVKDYIAKWQQSERMRKAVEKARERGYDTFIAQQFLAQGLPPQFFYLAMQESNFDEFISGPKTYKGFAKGMWQFIPETALKYGLQPGPLFEEPRPDPADDRHQWQKATQAAATYIKDLYTTDAQASGLLVMASYNWGEDKVLKLIRSLPPNPRERNFWALLEKYREQLPQETYDYVFYIVSASVIGENPRLFGFNWDNPLASAGK